MKNFYPEKLSIRLLNSSDKDSVRKLTDFLNICYKDRAVKGVDYLPDSQDEETTSRRIIGKEVWVCESDNQIVGTFTIASTENAKGTWWYRQPGVAEVSQIAVHPSLQGSGIFSFLVDAAKERALQMGSLELAGSVPSERKWLIKAYIKRGARIVDYKWKKNASYGSVIWSIAIQKNGLKSSLFRRILRRLKYFRRYIKYKLLRRFSKNPL